VSKPRDSEERSDPTVKCPRCRAQNASAGAFRQGRFVADAPPLVPWATGLVGFGACDATPGGY
jgi:hypothetical protein